MLSVEPHGARFREPAPHAHVVIEEQAQPDLPSRSQSFDVRQYELHRAHDVRSDGHQAFALLQRLAHEAELDQQQTAALWHERVALLDTLVKVRSAESGSYLYL